MNRAVETLMAHVWFMGCFVPGHFGLWAFGFGAFCPREFWFRALRFGGLLTTTERQRLVTHVDCTDLPNQLCEVSPPVLSKTFSRQSRQLLQVNQTHLPDPCGRKQYPNDVTTVITKLYQYVQRIYNIYLKF